MTKYCATCGHTVDRHRMALFGKAGTSCAAPLGHGAICPCGRWSPPPPPKPKLCAFCGGPLGVGGAEGRCAGCSAKTKEETTKQPQAPATSAEGD